MVMMMMMMRAVEVVGNWTVDGDELAEKRRLSREESLEPKVVKCSRRGDNFKSLNMVYKCMFPAISFRGPRAGRNA